MSTSEKLEKLKCFKKSYRSFQLIRRKRFDKLPIQANFYPMTTAAFIDSNNKRLTLLAGQSLGVASLNAGWIESILDRRLMQDDDRGIGQARFLFYIIHFKFRAIWITNRAPKVIFDYS